ncbi:hypothetical protein SAY86_029356 [Trapa natans]|uniref:Uncharacterized protein n=1 Tax=Trapa natans TaxID=22666 RepID=A0AAN7RCY7_TRANT|nr:hypothetical protein SAY86_029356 [Trapa natans]
MQIEALHTALPLPSLSTVKEKKTLKKWASDMENKRTEKTDSKAPLLIKRSKVGNSDMAEETSWKKTWGKDVGDEESDIYSSEWYMR